MLGESFIKANLNQSNVKMAAKKASKAKIKKKEIGANKPGEELPPLSPEYQKKYDDNKKNIDKFIKECLKNFDKYITGIAILPP